MTTLTLDQVRDSLVKGVAELEACAAGSDANDTVLAWDNHLGVLFREGKASAIHITKATALTPFAVRRLPTITNGAGDKAKVTKRGMVATAQAKSLRKILADSFPELTITNSEG